MRDASSILPFGFEVCGSSGQDPAPYDVCRVADAMRSERS